MRFTYTAGAAAAILLTLGVANAQETMQGHDMGSTTTTELPEACMSPGGVGSSAMVSPDMAEMGEHQRAFMEAMLQQHKPMMESVMADDPDVAFACGMISHHRAAIAMAEVELQFGDDDTMKELAQRIIDAQEQEIVELTTWIEEDAQ